MFPQLIEIPIVLLGLDQVLSGEPDLGRDERRHAVALWIRLSFVSFLGVFLDGLSMITTREGIGVLVLGSLSVSHLEVVVGEGPEPPLFELDRGAHVGQRLQRAVIGAEHEPPPEEVVTEELHKVESSVKFPFRGTVVALLFRELLGRIRDGSLGAVGLLLGEDGPDGTRVVTPVGVEDHRARTLEIGEGQHGGRG